MINRVPVWARTTFTRHAVQLGSEFVPYLVGGTGPALIMIHGLAGSLEWWRYNANEFARHYTVYMFDLPGFGRLGHLPTSGSMPEYTHWVSRLLDRIGIERANVLGHSMGGHIAVRLSVANPERVDRLILVSPAGVLPDAQLEHYILPALKLLREIPPRLLTVALRDVRRADLRTTWRSGHDLLENDILPLLPLVSSPTLLIWGEEDDITPFELSETFLERLPNARLVRVPGIGHLPMVDAAERFNQEVITFLEGSDD